MKFYSHLYIDVNTDEQILKQISQLSGFGAPVKNKEEKYYFTGAPMSSTKEFREIIELLENGKVRYDIHSILMHFNKAEIEGASFFEPYIPSISIDVFSDSSCKEVIRSMPRYGRSCVICDKQIDDDEVLWIKQPSKKFDIFHVVSLDRYIVAGKVKDAFIANGITGVEFLPVYVRGQALPSSEYCEMKVKNAMPALRKEDNPVLMGERLLHLDICPNCGRKDLGSGVLDKRVYRIEDVSSLCDFNHSVEGYFYGVKKLVLSKKARDLWVAYLFRGMKIEPKVTILTKEGEEIQNTSNQTMTSGGPSNPGVNRKPRTVTMSVARNKASRHFEQTVVERILQSAVESYRLYEKAPSGAPLFSSRIGGHPDLPLSLPWPEWKGRRLDFIAQINCSQLPKDALNFGFPASGMLWFFFDLTEQPWGNEPQDKGGFRILYQEAPSPDELHPEDKEQESTISPKHLGLTRELTFSPVIEDVLVDMEISEDLRGRHIDFLDSLHSEEDDLSRLWGYPDVVNRDLRIVSSIVSKGNELSSDSYAIAEAESKEETRNWVMLLQIDSDEDMGLMFGDMGKITYYIERDKLAKLDFSNAWCILSSN